MVRKSLIKSLLEEQIEFCCTSLPDIYGISKESIAQLEKGRLLPKMFINYYKNKHGIHITFSSEDDVYMYVKETKE